MSDQQYLSTNQRAGFPLFTHASASAVQSHSSYELNGRDLSTRLDYDWLPVISNSFSQQDQLHLTGGSDGCLIFSEGKKGEIGDETLKLVSGKSAEFSRCFRRQQGTFIALFFYIFPCYPVLMGLFLCHGTARGGRSD